MGKILEDMKQRRVGLTFIEKIRVIMMCFVLVFLITYLYTHMADFNPNNVREPWYLGHEREYQKIIKPDLPKEERLKEQAELKKPSFLIDKAKFPMEWIREEFAKEVEQNIKYFKDKPWLYILHKVGTMTQEEINAEVEKQDKEEKINYKHIIKVPEKLPGLFVDFKGSIVRIRRKEFVIENPYGIKELWEGQLFDREYRVISFQVFDPPTDLYLWDPVTIRGVFYKNWVYEDTQGNLKSTPLIIGRTLVKIPKTVDTASQSFQYLIVAIIFLGGVSLAIGIWIESKQTEKHRREFQQKQKEHAQKRASKIGISPFALKKEISEIKAEEGDVLTEKTDSISSSIDNDSASTTSENAEKFLKESD